MADLNFEILERLGKFTHEIRKEVSKIPKEGVDILEIVDFVENKIFDNGYLPAFPCTVCVNEVAAHYTVFDEGYVLRRGDVLKIDFGVSFDGFVTDCAFTVEIGDNKHEKLLSANLRGLNEVLDKIKIGSTLSELGEIVWRVADGAGFDTIHNLSGHEVCRNNLHCGLTIPNYKNHDMRKVNDGMELAIEPFLTEGEPKVKEVGLSNVLHLKKFRAVRDPIARKVLDYIRKNFPYLPFSKRWLLKAFEKRKVLYALKVLKSYSIVYEYGTLATCDGAIVSQFEDTVVFLDGKKKIITRL